MANDIHRLAFVDINGALHTCDADGGTARRLSLPGRWYQFPAWSPTSARIAAIGGNRSSAGVWVFEDRAATSATKAGLAVHNSLAHPPIYLYWSPDGASISFLAGDPQQETMGMFLTPADASQEPMRVTRGRPCFWAWSPDARGFLLHSGTAGDDARLNHYVVENGVPRIARNHIAIPGLFQSPGVSPSGKLWAFCDLDDEGQMRVVVTNGGQGDPLLVMHEAMAALQWSPKRDVLAMISGIQPQRGWEGELQLLHPATGDTEVLVESTVLAFFWSPDGRHIAYLCDADGPTNHEMLVEPVFPGEADTGGVFRSGSVEQLLRAAPDDAEDNEGGQPLSLWTVNVESGDRNLISVFEPNPMFEQQFLPFFDQYAHSHRIWSPDSSRVVMPLIMRGDDGEATPWIATFDIHTRTRTLIAQGLSAFWSWQ